MSDRRFEASGTKFFDHVNEDEEPRPRLAANVTLSTTIATALLLMEFAEHRHRRHAEQDARALEQRLAVDRAAADALREQHRAELAFRLERERLASRERIAEIEAQGRVVTAAAVEQGMRRRRRSQRRARLVAAARGTGWAPRPAVARR